MGKPVRSDMRTAIVATKCFFVGKFVFFKYRKKHGMEIELKKNEQLFFLLLEFVFLILESIGGKVILSIALIARVDLKVLQLALRWARENSREKDPINFTQGSHAVLSSVLFVFLPFIGTKILQFS